MFLRTDACMVLPARCFQICLFYVQRVLALLFLQEGSLTPLVTVNLSQKLQVNKNTIPRMQLKKY